MSLESTPAQSGPATEAVDAAAMARHASPVERHGAAGADWQRAPTLEGHGAPAMGVTAPPLPPARDEGETPYRLHRRFDRIGRLVGDTAMERLLGAHVMVIGLGGVGSFAVEALARSGIGRLTLVDFDRVCVTNSNRQLQAVAGTIARHKAAVLAERVRLINPQAVATPRPVFYGERTADELLGDGAEGGRPDFVVDAIDNIKAKCHLLARCHALGLPVVSATGASGRMDPTQVRVADLAETRVDPLADAVRRILRHKYGFPAKGPFGIPAVWSPEPLRQPAELHYDGGEGFRCVCPGGKNDHHSCEERPVIWGTAGFVTGAFGLACASVVVRAIAGGGPPPRAPGPLAPAPGDATTGE